MKKKKKINVIVKKQFSKFRFCGNDVNRNLKWQKRSFVIISKSFGVLTTSEIESARQAIRKFLKRSGRLLIRVKPTRAVTKKPLQVRMGKGKGSFSHFVCQVRPGKIIFELQSKVLGKEKLIAALKAGSRKLGVKTSCCSYLETFF